MTSRLPAGLCNAGLYIGLMTGTSMDAVDAALAQIELPQSPADSPPVRLVGFVSRPLPDALRVQLGELQASGPDELHRAALAGNALADLYSAAVGDLLAATGVPASRIAAIGAHGQTVRHRPDAGYTLQLNSPARLAERTGIAVVADLRSRDIAAGGQGAPLACAFHAHVLAHPIERRAVVNIGGIANVTLIEPAGRAVVGWDCGPGNVLMDGWCMRHLGKPFDDGGHWAASGAVLPALLDRLLAEPYLTMPAPKSTGRDLFNMAWLDTHLHAGGSTGAAAADVQATLLELTARTIAQACRATHLDRVLLCGGGVNNGALGDRLARLLAPVPLARTDDEGLPAQAIESLAFAWLAHRHLAGLTGNLPSVTGARGLRVLGALYPAR